MLNSKPLLFTSLFALTISTQLAASPSLAGGFWVNYSFNEDTHETDFGDQAIIGYLDRAKSDQSPWFYSAEFRLGPGSFTDVDNNSSGQKYVMHKAWLGYAIDDNNSLTFGKSQVPFGWKTANFWPGDMFLAAYGDQMDVGVKYQGGVNQFNYQLAYYLADDWASKSTDSTDDNRHWGSNSTYRKVDTAVVDFSYTFNKQHTFAASYQNGKLEELITGDRRTDGDHSAYVIYYQGQFDQLTTKLSYIDGKRDLPQAYLAANPDVASTIDNTRYAGELGYTLGDWYFVLDVTLAKSNTNGVDSDTVYAFAPGVRYDYGPGWLYLEYLNQDAYFDRNMQINQGDFAAWYLTFDYYW